MMATITMFLCTASLLSGSPPGGAIAADSTAILATVTAFHAALAAGDSAAALALLQYAQGERPAPWLRWALLVAALLLAWLLAWTAHQGGLIRHPELRALSSPLFPNL